MRRARDHRFSFRLFGTLLLFFFVFFAAQLAIDVPGEAWASLEASSAYAIYAGGCLARAGYCMLGIVLAFFLLSVPLAANFYTSKLIEVYLGDPVNIAVFAVGVLASANTHLATTIAWPSFHPSVALVVSAAIVAAAWAIILPYAFYAWRFLNPEVLLDREERTIERDLIRAVRPIGPLARRRIAARVRQTILDLANVAVRAADRADRDLALDGVRALGRTYTFYLDLKPVLPADWFEPERDWFAGLSNEAYQLIRRDRTWVGHLLLHQLWLAYGAALSKMPDAAGTISTTALGVAGEAARRGDGTLLALGLRFANTFLREAVKRGDAGTVQDVLRVHREMIARIAAGGGEAAAGVIADEAEHLRYYHETARVIGAHESADAVALALARLVELIATQAPRALLPALDVVERLDDSRVPDQRALVKARALVVAALEGAGRRLEAERLRRELGAAPAEARASVRASLEAAPTRSAAGREAFGDEPSLEFVAEPARSAMIALLAPG